MKHLLPQIDDAARTILRHGRQFEEPAYMTALFMVLFSMTTGRDLNDPANQKLALAEADVVMRRLTDLRVQQNLSLHVIH